MNLGQKMRQKWEKVPLRGAHIKYDDENEILNRFKILLTDKYSVKNKVIIDYGCGGGFLGKYLLDNFKIKKYIAYDIAKRSLDSAKKKLKNYNNTEFNFVENHDWNFKEKKVNIFCAFACLLHFPNKDYLDRFLNRVNNSDASLVVLEIRNLNEGTRFQENPYINFKSLVMACITDEEYINEELINYKLIDKTDHDKAPTNCQILYYRKQKNAINSTA